MLWLIWFAGLLEIAVAFAPLSKSVQAIAHGWLNAVERRIFIIVLARAAPYLGPVRACRVGPRCGRGALLRALMGSRLRRRLRDKDVYARVEKLAQDVDILVALHCRRVARGLTRLLPILTRPERHRLGAPFALPSVMCPADTS
jgi:hypothetical protein